MNKKLIKFRNMKIEIFNGMGFKKGDFVKVIKYDGSEEKIQLERGEIYMGSPEKRHYTTGEIIPGTPPCIVVQGTFDRPKGDGIPIADVEDVILLS
jgi:hypothetical protein